MPQPVLVAVIILKAAPGSAGAASTARALLRVA
jgi:hypothetical protein